ncbi:MBL fold metallo-hydrolase [Trichocoleus sp. FACHB-262]|uniref:MBL fold metallo-hydrolase n=1 Tax=Trichocoleus sp. FACHB-262 TaxID=2692869 RepID=UPI0016837282|nr:MBL fold metallo-hydrolase [Trichocoleus sp. FACHB-262]MBD2121457.1 MBL fold metallo-hydrolase [Trichocoleus sp. FACHB-262]
MPEPQSSLSKQPRVVLDGQPSYTLYAFPPNRDILGGTAYFIVGNDANILVDCPAWNEANLQFLQAQGGVRWLFITHRGGISKYVSEIQQTLGCQIVVQEQEAYLLPGLNSIQFHETFSFYPEAQALWTPGHSPGSACLYHQAYGGVLFSGRHLIPSTQGEPVPLRIAKTFHWPRQLRSIQKLLERFTPQTLSFICPGANTGFLRGDRAIAQAYDRLAQLDLAAYAEAKPLL